MGEIASSIQIAQGLIGGPTVSDLALNAQHQRMGGGAYPSVLTDQFAFNLMGHRGSNLLLPNLSVGSVATLQANIVAAGSTISDTHVGALRGALERLMHTSAWAKIVELWVPLGADLTAALQKIKTGSGVSNTLTNTAFVAGDYTGQTGLKGDGATKTLASALNFSTSGMPASSFGFGAYSLSKTYTGLLAGTTTGSSLYCAYAASNQSQMGGATVTHTIGGRWNAVQISAGQVQSYNGGFQFGAATATGSLPNSTLSIGSSGAAFFCNGYIGGYCVFSPAMSAAEHAEVARFFDSVSIGIGRIGVGTTLVVTGDSNAAGTGLGSPSTQRYGALLSASWGLTEDNSGLASTTMSSSDNGSSASRWVTQRKSQYTICKAGALYTVMLGTNDDRYGVPPDAYASDYETWLNYQFSAGIDPSQMILCGLPAATEGLTSKTRQQAFSRIVNTLATRYGCGFVDIYALTVGQAYFQGDNLHLNTTGHTAVSNAIQTAMNSQGFLGGANLVRFS